MNHLLIPALAFAWLAILVGGWLGWQLMRQNGRLLLRVEGFEDRLNELEFGGPDVPAGLPICTLAPGFDLPDLAGGRKTLDEFRGQALLIIFFNPTCGYCRDLGPKLVAFSSCSRRGNEADFPNPKSEIQNPKADDRLLTSAPTENLPQLIILTTGDGEKNREFFREHNLYCPVLLQKETEVATAYEANGTPSGYLISAEGRIGSELAMGAEALLKLASQPAQELPLTLTLSPSDGEREIYGEDGDGRANRFSNRSLGRSKIKRDGLKAGTPAPDFRLPRLDGRGDLSLEEFRGRRVLLVFSSPHCGPCDALAPELEKFHREQGGTERPLTLTLSPSEEERRNLSEVAVVMISKGEPKENRAKVKEHRLTFPVVLQQQWEISRRYAMFATPVAYLINQQGVIAQDVAVGSDAILELMARTLPPLEHFSPAGG